MYLARQAELLAGFSFSWGLKWNLFASASVSIDNPNTTDTLTNVYKESFRVAAKFFRKERRKTMRDKRLWILLGGIALISAAFLLLNFRVATSDTQAIQKILTTELEGNYPDRLQRNDRISLVLVGEGPLAGALQKALTEKMDKAGMGELELAQEREPRYPNPVLVVTVSRPTLIWAPFFAMSQFSMHAGYATNGDATFMEDLDKTQPYIRNPDPSAVNLYTEYEGTDRSYGLISHPGYHQYLADYLAQEIVQALKNLYNIQDLGG